MTQRVFLAKHWEKVLLLNFQTKNEVILKAPITGKISAIFPTKHAYVFESLDEVKVLVHIGLDTVNLKGEGFESLVSIESMVKKGEPFAKVNLKLIRENNLVSDAIVTVLPESNVHSMDIVDLNSSFITTDNVVIRVKK
ncbi:PTS sugar transporter subunit IIA [Mycoplasmopsis cynos]|uniref:PTS sugar transporter subunit IIA n=1 Tax=Mycoplasmopsis cynos TaxID=171284 RepID=UPI0024CA6722|nr:PTS glucose transporter subunit IIA [Mycoplasmopsis cynos]WAM07537.1 PTS glucose transporter subunit IIA [Mycoplasmopsis cynos]